MASDKNIERVTPGGLSERPDFIKTGQEKEGTERLQQFIQPPLLKIVQKQSDDELLDRYGRGTTILTPTGVEIAKQGVPFYIVPIIQYPEYMTWAPNSLRGQVPPILDRSLDPNSYVGKKAQNRDTWFEYGYTLPDGRKIGNKDADPKADPWANPVRHVEHITFVVMILDEDIGEVPCIMSFARGSHKSGRNFASLLHMRNADAFGCVFEAVVGEPLENEQGSWFAWQVRNPSPDAPYGPWVTDEASYSHYASVRAEMEKAYQDDILRADYAAAEDEVGTRDDL